MKVLFLIAIFLSSSLHINAQIPKSTLTGIVCDQVSGVIPKAKVKIRGNKNTKYFVETNDDGIYEISLPDGVYTLEFEASGHKSFKVKEYRIGTYQKLRLDIVLYAPPTPII